MQEQHLCNKLDCWCRSRMLCSFFNVRAALRQRAIDTQRPTFRQCPRAPPDDATQHRARTTVYRSASQWLQSFLGKCSLGTCNTRGQYILLFCMVTLLNTNRQSTSAALRCQTVEPWVAVSSSSYILAAKRIRRGLCFHLLAALRAAGNQAAPEQASQMLPTHPQQPAPLVCLPPPLPLWSQFQ